MTTKDLIVNEIQKIPESLLREVLDFIQFLETKIADRKMDLTLAGETSLAKDWLKKEEDKAWQNL